ncbi:nicotinamide mononucleotide adenylyltransferase [Paracoccidioides lutzii Pb01]|uniref:Nicotinamide-nucleotide adenylyltransferase n=1 Tax=Paracoccidioides lutzii (strain ATCC MYA-826 / Pb01) TaxID=502779 RepID=C1HBJ0_PARBA|nr:nicotinamide mononucleotide adenylyltransferase [Paracoccidioides lutzii Pb01]EEH38404.1 nicotinamide mononucleotide adenylyltransferase [Paracoccidioides lutzii Pb01]
MVDATDYLLSSVPDDFCSTTSSTTSSITTSIPPMDPDSYTFPNHRLKNVMSDPSKTPLLLVACGSFSPTTYLHLRMFEMAADYVKFSTDFELIGGYLSPVSDAYKKAGLASAVHRVAMCQLAVEKTSNWLMVDPWEPMQKEYIPTAVVLDHFDYYINQVLGGIDTGNGTRRPVHVALLAGADLIHTMSTPGVWSEKDLDHILGQYGTFIVERAGTDIDEAIASLQPWKENIYVIQQLIQNDVSSTKIRLFLRREMSVRYLIPSPVIDYIEKHHLYEDEGSSSSAAASTATSAATSNANTASASAARSARAGKGKGKQGQMEDATTSDVACG